MTSPTSSSIAEASDRDISLREAPYIVFSGFGMGTADVVPGVSGGTMAVALGIYHQLLSAIASINGRAARAVLQGRLKDCLATVHYRFLGSLGIGIGLGILLMVKVVKLPERIIESPKPVYAVFFGLVLASAVLLGRTITGWGPARVAAFLGGTLCGFAVVNLVPVETPTAPWFIFASGFVAICAMVLPGISGSFVLLILRKYAYVLDALGNLNLAVIAPFGLGCLIGIATFSRVVAWALSRYREPVMAGLAGLLVGSLWRIWPYQDVVIAEVRGKSRVLQAQPYLPDQLEPAVLALCVTGMALVLALEFVAGFRTRVRT